jgi:hypothetical protein
VAHIRIAVAIIILLFSGSCIAQASLAVTNGDGKLVGWLLGKIPATDHIQLLTPQGYVLTIQRSGYLRNSTGTTVNRILYEKWDCGAPVCSSNPCGGNAWAITSYENRGEILQVGGQTGGAFFGVPFELVERMLGVDELADPLIVEQKGPDGTCVPVDPPLPLLTSGIQVEEINPADYGIREYNGLNWGVPTPHTTEVQRPEGLFCNGFENCPTQ